MLLESASNQSNQPSSSNSILVADLLDPIRDAQYLNGQIIVDNPVLYNFSQYANGINSPYTPSQNTYLCWFGMPPGTNPLTESFNLYCAKAHPDKYTLGATPNTWLETPFLVLSVQQLQADVINWFNANYPAGASNGVGNALSTPSFSCTTLGNTNVNIQCNSTYGCISSQFSPGNVTGTPTVKQFHMVYDPIGNSVIIYISMVTPNWNPNTKAIYVYEVPISLFQNGQSIDSNAVNGLTPTPTSYPPPSGVWFLGGLTLDEPFTISFVEYWTCENTLSALGANQVPAGVMSAPQFTIAFDYLKLAAPYGYQLSNGYLPALLVAVEGYMMAAGSIDGPNGYPHGDGILIALLQDIHNNPANPTVVRIPYTSAPESPGTSQVPFASHLPGTDRSDWGMVVDKFGSIIPMQNEELLSGYTVLYSTPSRVDVKLSSMRVQALFIEPAGYLPVVGAGQYFNIAFTAARTETLITPTHPVMGYCRPYIYTLPSGYTLVTFGGYYSTNYINAKAALIDPKILAPSSHKKLYAYLSNAPSITTATAAGVTYNVWSFGHGLSVSMDGRLLGNFNKKYANLRLTYCNDGTSVMLYATKYSKLWGTPLNFSWYRGGNVYTTAGLQNFSQYMLQSTGLNDPSIEGQIDVAPLNDLYINGQCMGTGVELTDDYYQDKMAKKILLFSTEPYNTSVVIGSSGYYGIAITGGLSSTTTAYPTHGGFACKNMDVFIMINSVSGTFATGQGLSVSINSPVTGTIPISPPITTTGSIIVRFRETETSAVVLGQTIKLNGISPYVTSTGGAYFTFNITGTSPSFGVDIYGLCYDNTM